MVNQYKYKFYLNANHAIFINNVLGQMHPHTWEIMIEMLSTKENFVQFDKVEIAISKLLEKYQDQFLNTIEPFDKVNPTLENIVIYFKKMIEEQIREYNMVLLSIEISETPSRSYIINSYDEVEEKYLNMNKYANDEESFINQIVRKNRKEQPITEEIVEDVAETIIIEEAASAKEPEEEKYIEDDFDSYEETNIVSKHLQIFVVILLVIVAVCLVIKNRNVKRTRKEIRKLLEIYETYGMDGQE